MGLFFFKFVYYSTKNKHNSTMRNILVIGAGKSCSYLTDYLQKKSTAEIITRHPFVKTLKGIQNRAAHN